MNPQINEPIDKYLARLNNEQVYYLTTLSREAVPLLERLSILYEWLIEEMTHMGLAYPGSDAPVAAPLLPYYSYFMKSATAINTITRALETALNQNSIRKTKP